jgi:tetratricopeptide (TPR) repeat protein
MRILTRFGIAVLAVSLAAAASGQEPTDPFAELGLIDDSSPATDEAPTQDAPELQSEDPERPLTEEDVLREHAKFVSLLEEQNYDAADIAAKRVIEMSIKVYGPMSHETAKALNNLGVVQNSNGQYEAAAQNFASAIELLEILEDRLNSQLINPLKGLGQAQLGSGRPDLARDTYARATHITHVNEGPHNVEQVEILESLAEAYVRLGDVESARDVLDRIHILNVRHFSDDAMGLLPSLMRRADWQHRAGYYNDERATYRRAIRIIEDSAGKEDPRLVDPLIKLGKSFYYFEPLPQTAPRYVGNATGESYLKRANRIAERAEDFPWLELATTKLALADFYVFAESYSRADNIYEEVWNELSTDADRLEMRSELLGQPRPIWTETLPPYTSAAAGVNRVDGEVQTGVVTIIYDVTQRGRARILDVKTEPAEFTDMGNVVEREIRRRVYRPLVIDGDAKESATQVFTHEFRYTRSELEAKRESSSSTEQAAANAK